MGKSNPSARGYAVPTYSTTPITARETFGGPAKAGLGRHIGMGEWTYGAIIVGTSGHKAPPFAGPNFPKAFEAGALDSDEYPISITNQIGGVSNPSSRYGPTRAPADGVNREVRKGMQKRTNQWNPFWPARPIRDTPNTCGECSQFGLNFGPGIGDGYIMLQAHLAAIAALHRWASGKATGRAPSIAVAATNNAVASNPAFTSNPTDALLHAVYFLLYPHAESVLYNAAFSAAKEEAFSAAKNAAFQSIKNENDDAAIAVAADQAVEGAVENTDVADVAETAAIDVLAVKVTELINLTQAQLLDLKNSVAAIDVNELATTTLTVVAIDTARWWANRASSSPHWWPYAQRVFNTAFNAVKTPPQMQAYAVYIVQREIGNEVTRAILNGMNDIDNAVLSTEVAIALIEPARAFAEEAVGALLYQIRELNLNT